MKIVDTISEMTQIIKNIKTEKKSIGFVPTMGFLHKGHCSLFDRSIEHCDITIASIFVNPTQFAPNEDYNKYPRNLENDIMIAKNRNVDCLFAPNVTEMYPKVSLTTININKIANSLEGKLRPGHFEGVALVLIKLFNIIKPDYVFLGQKDYQQTLIVKQIIIDLNINTEIIVTPTIRDDNGLAISSRNSYLTNKELVEATILYQAISAAKDIINKGEHNRNNINAVMHQILRKNSDIKIDYAAIVMADDLSEPNTFQRGDKAVLLLAVYIGKTRLIDNSMIIFT